MSKPVLVVMARDEERSIGRCLESARPFVERMVLVDTGSRDRTAAIAAELGAEVHHLAWNDDFGDMRNQALALAGGQWRLVLDADEWIDPSAQPGELWSALTEPAGFVGLVPVSSEFELQGQPLSSTLWICRLLPPGARYAGRVHEQVVGDLPRRRVRLPVRHDGYTGEALLRKKGRNHALLLRALQERPGDAYLLYQLGKDYEVYADFPQAAQRYAEALAASGQGDAYRHDLVVRAIYSLKCAGLHEQAIQLADAEMPNWPNSPDYYFALGDLLLDWATLNPSESGQLLPMVEAAWLRCLEIGERPELDGTVQGRGSHLAAHNLAVLYDGLGDAEKAAQYRLLAQRR